MLKLDVANSNLLNDVDVFSNASGRIDNNVKQAKRSLEQAKALYSAAKSAKDDSLAAYEQLAKKDQKARLDKKIKKAYDEVNSSMPKLESSYNQIQAKFDLVGKSKNNKEARNRENDVQKLKNTVKKEAKDIEKAANTLKGLASGKTWMGRSIKNVAKTVKKFGLSVNRNAFLSLVSLNVGDLAGKMGKNLDAAEKGDVIAKEKMAKLYKVWERFGGNKISLINQIAKGKDKTPIKFPSLRKKTSFNGDVYSDVGGGDDAVIIGYITAAASVIAVVLPIIIGKKAPSDIEDEAKDQGFTDDELDPNSKERIEGTEDGAGDDEEGGDNTLMWVGIGALALVVVVGVVYAIKKSNAGSK